MKRVLVMLVAGAMLSGFAAYVAAASATAADAQAPEMQPAD